MKRALIITSVIGSILITKALLAIAAKLSTDATNAKLAQTIDAVTSPPIEDEDKE